MITEEDRIGALKEFLGDDDDDSYEVSNYSNIVIEYDNDSAEYMVLTDVEAEEEFKGEEQDIIDEIGFEGFSESFRQEVAHNYVDSDSFFSGIESDEEDAILNSPDSYTNFWPMDEIRTNLAKKISDEDSDILSVFEDDIVEWDESLQESGEYLDERQAWDFLDESYDDDELLDKLHDDVPDFLYDYVSQTWNNYIEEFDNAYDYLENMYGNDDTTIFKILEPYIAMDDVLDAIKEYDGRGPALARYDGAENEVEYDGTDWFIYRVN